MLGVELSADYADYADYKSRDFKTPERDDWVRLVFCPLEMSK